ncbi:MAG: twin-arginine translocase subunit TatC [Candidatus Goldbacteria bacterium]|nr:twin-arginine translocase subunit TatC [Candidatus Goldiibacteriota bacterium]
MIKKNSYLYHLEELRWTILSILFFLFIAFIFSMFFIEKIIIFLQEPIKDLNIKLSYFRPEEKFLTYLKVGFFSSIFLSIPFAIIRFGYFIYPALKKNEKKYFYIFIILLPLIFYTGVFFAYKIVFPFALRFFYNFAGNNTLIPLWGISNYFDLLIMLTTATGVVFLLPIPLIFFIKAGIISVGVIDKLRPYIIIIILIIAAIFSPPDVVSQILIAVPLYLLFELSVIIGKIIK